uniref:Uncharacterized protein n=1 Tax=Aegilops tauschii subsp. strangulata TaxID=200361 RepID=A0A453HW03_AEGTS
DAKSTIRDKNAIPHVATFSRRIERKMEEIVGSILCVPLVLLSDFHVQLFTLYYCSISIACYYLSRNGVPSVTFKTSQDYKGAVKEKMLWIHSGRGELPTMYQG